MVYILFVIWFVLLIKWADLLIDWASSVARKFNISSIVIWLTIVAFWTSAPELIVNIISAVSWKTDLAMWNILWSNIANILLIIWITAIIYPITAKKNTVWKEIPFWLLAVVILWIVANDIFIDWAWTNIISRIDWLVFLSFFVIFIVYTFSLPKTSYEEKEAEKGIIKMSTPKSILYILLGLTWLAVWWNWIVDWATALATILWLSEKVIGLTIVAIWTSLPELATSVIAAMKKETDIAIWNIAWSNIFNILFVLWTTSVIKPIPTSASSNIDIFVTIFVTLIFFWAMFIWKKYTVERRQGIIMLTLYVAYIAFLLIYN